MKVRIIFILFFVLTAKSETYEQYTKRINEVIHVINEGETLEKILIDKGYKNLDGVWGARRQTMLKNGINEGEVLVPGEQLILPYAPGEGEKFKARSLAQDKSYDLGEPLNIEAPTTGIPLTTPDIEVVEPEPETQKSEGPMPLKEEPQPITEKPEKVIVNKEVIKEKIVYRDKSKETYENWSYYQFFFQTQFTKLSLTDPSAGTAELDSQYHFDFGARWNHKWEDNLFIYTHLNMQLLSFDKPPGVSFSKGRFFLPGLEVGALFTTDKERISLGLRYQSEAQALTKVNTVLSLTTLETTSLVFEFERIIESKRNLKFSGFAGVNYIIPTENNGVEIEDGYEITVGGSLKYEKRNYHYQIRPYLIRGQKNTDLTDESRSAFGIQFSYGKDF